MLHLAETNVPLKKKKKRHGIFEVGIFAAIQAAPRQKAGKLGDRYAKQLLVHNMIDALLQIGDLVFQPLDQSLCK